MRKAMHDLGLTPDVVLVSPSRRTLETLAALEPWDDTPLVEQVETLYLASLPQLLGILRGVNETVRSVMLIGHNPGMHELAVLLAGTSAANEAGNRLAAGFPTAALAEFSVATQWRQLDASGCQAGAFPDDRGTCRRRRPERMELELGLDPDDAARLPRLALLAPLKSGRPRSRAVRIVWHDSPDRALARARSGCSPSSDRTGGWSGCFRTRESWPPGAPAPVLATGRDVAALGHDAARPAGADGRVRRPGTLSHGARHRAWTGHADPAERHGARGRHRVSASAAFGSRATSERCSRWRSRWPASFALAVPRASLAAEAFAATSGHRAAAAAGRARPNCPPGCRSPRRSPMSSAI